MPQPNPYVPRLVGGIQRCTLMIALYCLSQTAIAATPLVEVISRPLASQQVLPNANNIVFYTLRNNTSVTFPLTVHFSSPLMQVATAGNTCNNQLQAFAACILPVAFTAPNSNQTIAATLSLDYHGRSPVKETLTYSVNSDITCQLLPIASYQTSFCQSQYQQVLLQTANLFNPANSNVIVGQALGGMIGIYHHEQNSDEICHISCGLRALNGSAPDENTIFELASVTKTFTGSILGKKVHLNEVNPLNSVNGFLPPGTWNTHSFSLHANEQPVTFQDLATFSGGVCFSDAPTVAINSGNVTVNQGNFVRDINLLNPADATCPGGGNNVHAAYPTHALLPTDNFYSNSSVGLLGQVLMSIDGYLNMDQPDFNGWMCQHILTPLQMTQTNACLPSEIAGNTCTDTGAHCNTTAWSSEVFSDGFTVSGAQFNSGASFPYVPWAAAGNIRSNTVDMIKYIKANLGIYSGNDPAVLNLIQGMKKAHISNNYLPKPNGANLRLNSGSQTPLHGGQGYGWVCMPLDDAPNAVCGKIGGHTRFRSFVGFSDSKQYGIVILINSGNGSSGGFRLTVPPTPADVGVALINQFSP